MFSCRRARLGKTLLAKTLARTLGGEFKRIQGTPDLMPSDIIRLSTFLTIPSAASSSVPVPCSRMWCWWTKSIRAGPQDAVCVARGHGGTAGQCREGGIPAADDFLVLATQNPREFEGTYPLPESQLDRFMLRIDMDYPERAAEAEILARYGGMLTAVQTTLETVGTLDPALLKLARDEADRIHVSEALAGYVLDLARASRAHTRLSLGLSTRGALSLLKAARIVAGCAAMISSRRTMSRKRPSGSWLTASC